VFQTFASLFINKNKFRPFLFQVFSLSPSFPHGLSKQNVIPGHQILKTRMLTLPQKQPAMVLKNFAFLVKNLLFRSPTKKKKD
jgi:hypothetical protein